MVKLRKSNILAPKHGGDGVILASVICMTCAVHIIQVSGSDEAKFEAKGGNRAGKMACSKRLGKVTRSEKFVFEPKYT